MRHLGWLGLLLACGGKDGDTGSSPDAPVQTGLGVQVRSIDGAPAWDVEVKITRDGATVVEAQPDAAGFAVFKDLKLGTVGVEVLSEGYTTQHAVAKVVEGRMGGVQFYLRPLEQTPVPLDQPTDLIGPDLVVSLPAGSLVGADGVGGVDISHALLVPEESRVVPGNLERLSPEGVVESLDVDLAFFLKRPADATFTGPAQVRLAAPKGSDRLERSLFLYTYDYATGYWRGGNPLVVEGDALVAEINNLGWWVAASAAPVPSCLTGSVRDEAGAPISGAELLAVQDGVFGVLRAQADSDGAFCLAVKPDRQGQTYLLGWSATLSTVYKDAPFFLAPPGPATCAEGGCLNLGYVEPDSYPDGDGDGYYDEVGDCNDRNPNINPSPAFGDGSSCYAD
jgi:hypothetical protein